mgnify:FL=1
MVATDTGGGEENAGGGGAGGRRSLPRSGTGREVGEAERRDGEK